jgi:hypothetical protein
MTCHVGKKTFKIDAGALFLPEIVHRAPRTDVAAPQARTEGNQATRYPISYCKGDCARSQETYNMAF